MKRLCIIAGWLLCFVIGAQQLNAQNPKREFRAAWITTAWAIDWPKNSWGNAAKAAQQKQELVDMLDSLQAANMNVAWLQVRSFCDAMYRSKYEPWSKYLTGTRGGTPAYDPLQFAITEAHKRGMELHAWLNPYRYGSSSDTYGTLPTDYANTHLEWLMKYGDATILNPGLPEVRKQIAAVVADIVENYDVDGIIFDDYFYISGTPFAQDAELYAANNPDGLSQADWRRENVNEMVRLVHDTIKAVKPWVKFGIGPAPQVASTQEHADKYGVDRMTFSDWQYNGIYSDPLAWITRGTVDYISPQIYWAVVKGSETAFGTFSAWWAKVANMFGVHFYASHSVGEVGTSYAPTETERQIRCVRSDDRNNAPGSVFYSVYNAIYTKGFIRHLRNTVYSTPALPPADKRYDTDRQLFVSAIRYSSYMLSWTPPADNLRYAVYCIPKDSIGYPGIFASSRYLLGMTYDTQFKVPLKSNYTYAVSVIDRYGNEFPPMVRDASTTTLNAPQLVAPVNADTVICPNWLRWNAVKGADSYLVQVADDADFTQIRAFNEVSDTAFYMGHLAFLADMQTYYWRVRTRAANAVDAYSETGSFVCDLFSVTSPAVGEKDVPLQPLLTCDVIPGDNVSYTFEIAADKTFSKSQMVFSSTTRQPSCRVPESTLAQLTDYFVRATGHITSDAGEQNITSEIVNFRTMALPVPTPVILTPHDNDTISPTEVQVSWLPQNAVSFRVEMSTKSTFPPRFTSVLIADAYASSVVFTELEEGEQWLRVRAVSQDGFVDSQVIHLYLQTPTSLSFLSDGNVQIRGNAVWANQVLPMQLFTADGKCLWTGHTVQGTTLLPAVPQGTYLLLIKGETIKIRLNN